MLTTTEIDLRYSFCISSINSMKAVLTDTDLVGAIKGGTRIGAEMLYDQYAVTLYKVICCTVKDQKTAEAILKRTFEKIWNNIDEYQPQNTRLLLWMAGIAKSFTIINFRNAKSPFAEKHNNR